MKLANDPFCVACLQVDISMKTVKKNFVRYLLTAALIRVNQLFMTGVKDEINEVSIDDFGFDE